MQLVVELFMRQIFRTGLRMKMFLMMGFMMMYLRGRSGRLVMHILPCVLFRFFNCFAFHDVRRRNRRQRRMIRMAGALAGPGFNRNGFGFSQSRRCRDRFDVNRFGVNSLCKQGFSARRFWRHRMRLCGGHCGGMIFSRHRPDFNRKQLRGRYRLRPALFTNSTPCIVVAILRNRLPGQNSRSRHDAGNINGILGRSAG